MAGGAKRRNCGDRGRGFLLVSARHLTLPSGKSFIVMSFDNRRTRRGVFNVGNWTIGTGFAVRQFHERRPL